MSEVGYAREEGYFVRTADPSSILGRSTK